MASHISGQLFNTCWDNWLAIWKEKLNPYLTPYTTIYYKCTKYLNVKYEATEGLSKHRSGFIFSYFDFRKTSSKQDL